MRPPGVNRHSRSGVIPEHWPRRVPSTLDGDGTPRGQACSVDHLRRLTGRRARFDHRLDHPDCARPGGPSPSFSSGGGLCDHLFAWRAFRRSHGDNVSGSTNPNGSTKWQKRLQRPWAVAVVAAATVGLMDLSNSTQMVYLAVLTGFMWPMVYWNVRAFVKHPERREKLWAMPFNASSVPTDSAGD